jgi:hypothetical protein
MHNKGGSRGRIMYLHARPHELASRYPVPFLRHTPELWIRRDADRAGTFSHTEEEVAPEEADQFVHFGDWFPGAAVESNMHTLVAVRGTKTGAQKGEPGIAKTGERAPVEGNAQGPILMIVNGVELRDEGEFVALRELEEFGIHLGHR